MTQHDNANSARTVISSRNNPLIKAIRGLSSRKQRDHAGRFFIDGLHLVAAAIEQHAEIETVVFAPSLLNSAMGHELVQVLMQRKTPLLEVTSEVFQSLAAKEHAQGLGLIVRQRWHHLAQLQPGAGQCWVALDTIQYPGNLGTILRTCDAVGAAGVVLLGPSTDPYDPIAVRASLGAVFAQRMVRASFAELLEWRKRHCVPMIGTSPAATLDYQAVAYQSPLVLLMGCEARGLTPEQQDGCDLLVHIPMIGQSDSLNLAVATGLVLYEIFNQQRRTLAARMK